MMARFSEILPEFITDYVSFTTALQIAEMDPDIKQRALRSFVDGWKEGGSIRHAATLSPAELAAKTLEDLLRPQMGNGFWKGASALKSGDPKGIEEGLRAVGRDARAASKCFKSEDFSVNPESRMNASANLAFGGINSAMKPIAYAYISFGFVMAHAAARVLDPKIRKDAENLLAFFNVKPKGDTMHVEIPHQTGEKVAPAAQFG